MFTAGSEQGGPYSRFEMLRRNQNETGEISGESAATPDMEDGEESEADGHRSASGSRHRDPLSWFGGLVPPTLREAQASFKAGVRR